MTQEASIVIYVLLPARIDIRSDLLFNPHFGDSQMCQYEGQKQ